MRAGCRESAIPLLASVQLRVRRAYPCARADQLSCNLREQVVCVLFLGERLAEQRRDIPLVRCGLRGRVPSRSPKYPLALDFLSRCHDAQIRIRRVAVARCTECDSRNASIATRTDYVLYVRCADCGSVWSIPSLQPPDAQTPCSSVLSAFQSGGRAAETITWAKAAPGAKQTRGPRHTSTCRRPSSPLRSHAPSWSALRRPLSVSRIVTVAVPWPRDRLPEVV